MDIQKVLIQPMLDRRLDLDIASEYYEGTQGERFLNKRFHSDFKDTYCDRTTLNFMRPVVDNVVNRLEIANVVGKDQAITEMLGNLRTEYNMPLLEKEVHRMASSLGEAYVMVWARNGKTTITVHDPRNTILIFDPETNEKLVGAQVWYDEINGGHKMHVLLPDRVDKYVTKSEELTAGTTWSLVESVDNPFGEVPLFLFTPEGRKRHIYPHEGRRYHPYGRPEHFDGYAIQDAINKLAVTHMVTVDYQGAPQRYALAHPDAEGMEVDDFDEGETNREQHGLKNGPGELWYMRGISSVGEFKPADPEAFLKPTDHHVRCLAAITNTPLHYFKETGNIPSGNALRAAEAPLLKKVGDRKASYGISWREVYTFAAKLEDLTVELIIHWAAVESIDILEEWDVVAKKANTGVPFRQRMLEAGYDEPTIDRMIEWKQQEDMQMGNLYQRAANTNPDVRTNINQDETKIDTGATNG